MTRRQAIYLSLALAVLAVAGALLACGSFGEMREDVAAYELQLIPPYWICASATPTPTMAPPPRPTWLPTTTPWDPATSTPWPTPTPYYRFGQFFRHQRIWLPIRPVPPDASRPLTDTARNVISVMLNHYTPLEGYVPEPGASCIGFSFEVHNWSTSPVDFDLPTMVFLRSSADAQLYRSSPEYYEETHTEYPNPRIPPQSSVDVSVPICFVVPPDSHLVDHMTLGLLTSVYETRAGSEGLNLNAPTGADTAIYINFWQFDPECSYPPEKGLYPELPEPPIAPPSFPFFTSQMGGRISGDFPVSIPPCLYITRGFGCSDSATGVSGGERCPPGMYWHTGIDFSCYEGTPVVSPLGGVIDHWGWNDHGYGNLASVSNGPLRSMYAHLSAFGSELLCSGYGGMCEEGSVIGYTGNTGHSTGPHLHWEVRLNGEPIDPQMYFGGSGNSRRAVEVAALDPFILSYETPTPLPHTPAAYPLIVRLRDPQGRTLSGAQIRLTNIDGRPAGECIVADGRCDFALPNGVYSLQLTGSLSDGTPVDAYGQANVEAMQSGRAEYLYGPLAVWHEGPGTTAGLVLMVDETGVAQPYLDADPTGAPHPLDPRKHLAVLQQDHASPPPISHQSTPAPVAPSETTGRVVGWLVFLVLVLLSGVFVIAVWAIRSLRARTGKRRAR